jgi:hypothetical protein
VSKAAAFAAAVNTDKVDGSKHFGIYLICADATSSGNLRICDVVVKRATLVSDVRRRKMKDFPSLIWESTSKLRFKAHKGLLHDPIASEIRLTDTCSELQNGSILLVGTVDDSKAANATVGYIDTIHAPLELKSPVALSKHSSRDDRVDESQFRFVRFATNETCASVRAPVCKM